MEVGKIQQSRACFCGVSCYGGESLSVGYCLVAIWIHGIESDGVRGHTIAFDLVNITNQSGVIIQFFVCDSML